MRDFVAGVLLAGEHVCGHVGQYGAAGGELVLVINEIRVPQVMGHGLVPVVRLRDEQVRAGRGRWPVPVGPATTSGAVRPENWPSRIRNGSLPKWSPCR